MIVLDTNVVSEVMKPATHRSPLVYAWLRRQPLEAVFTTTITIAEIFAGVAILPAGKRRDQLREAAERILATVFPNRVLPFDEPAARLYAEIITYRRRRSMSIDPLDLQIAAAARSRGMAVATRNLDDFEGSGVDVIDPWSA